MLALALVLPPTLRDAHDTGRDARDVPPSAAGTSDAATSPGSAGTSGHPPGAPPPSGVTPTSGVEAAPTPAATEVPGDAVSEAAATSPPVPAVDGPFPATAESAVGRLVASYPVDVLPLAPGTTVGSSSVSVSGERVQVALVADSASAGDDVLAFYLRTLRAQGFVEEPATTAPGQVVVAVRRAGSSVVVTTGPGDEAYSIYAILQREDA